MNMQLASVSVLALSMATPALAQAQPADPALASKTVAATADPSGGADVTTTEQPTPAQGAVRQHTDQDQVVVVTGVRRRAQDVLGGVSVLDEAELNRAVRPSIGETLANLPGVSATSFGPKASSPVLRGLQGERIRVLTDGIGTLDMSTLGPDHEVAINPITAQRIEVLRGPAALLFGSAAIGGVVNVIDARIPRTEPTGPIGFDGFASYGTAAKERAINGSVNLPVFRHLILHADGNYDKTDDLKIGGHVLSPQLRQEALDSGDPEIAALADLKGTLPHSRSRTTEGALGLAYVDGGLNLGVSVTRHTSRYQIPIRYELEPGAEPEMPTLTPRQTRYDARAEIPLGGFFNQIRARAGYSRYQHDELEADGSVGSHFQSHGGEGRFELVQANHGGWSGTTGIQYLNRNALIIGEEVYLPFSRQKQSGLFTLQTYVAGPFRFEVGGRIEVSRLTARANEQIGTPDRSDKFTALSGSLGGQYELTPGWRLGVSLSHSERAPFVNELFAQGPHGGDEIFEQGDPGLGLEKSNSAELSLHGTTGPVHLTGNLYYSRFSNFVFQSPTGDTEEESGLPIYVFLAGKANYYGFELQADTTLGTFGGIHWGTEAQADYVRATVKDYGPAPLIPPLRLGGALTGSSGPFDGRLEVQRAFSHDRIAPNETTTAGYTMVNASLDWHPLVSNPGLTLSLSGNNLFDVEARRSTSILKDYAPLAGRDIRLSLRVNI